MRKTLLVLAALAAMSTVSLAQQMKRSDDLRTAQAKEMIVMTQTMVDEMQAMIDKLSGMLTAYERQIRRSMERQMGGDDH